MLLILRTDLIIRFFEFLNYRKTKNTYPRIELNENLIYLMRNNKNI